MQHMDPAAAAAAQHMTANPLFGEVEPRRGPQRTGAVLPQNFESAYGIRAWVLHRLGVQTKVQTGKARILPRHPRSWQPCRSSLRRLRGSETLQRRNLPGVCDSSALLCFLLPAYIAFDRELYVEGDI